LLELSHSFHKFGAKAALELPGKVWAGTHELALHNVYFTGVRFYHTAAAYAAYGFGTLFAGFGKLAGAYPAFGVFVALMCFYLYSTSKTFVVGFGIGHIGTNVHIALAYPGNTYATAQPAGIYKYGPAGAAFVNAPLGPWLQTVAEPCLPLKAVEEEINSIVAKHAGGVEE
jgi:hypothetical protein